MEINHYFDDIVGVIPTADIVEGRMVVFTTHTHSYDFGSKTDLPGVKVPATAEEANNARHIITWQKDSRPYPAALPVPEYSFNLRQGFGKTSNAPFAATVYLTDPGNQEGLTIPSGSPSLAFGKGIYTVASGCYIDHNSIIYPGALLQVANTAEDSTDAGKLKYLSAYSTRKVGTVREYDSSTGRLTFELD